MACAVSTVLNCLRTGALLLGLCVALGCARTVATTTPLPVAGGAVAVFPPHNRTGDDLLIAGASYLEKYALRSDRITVPDVVVSEARRQLARRGSTVVPAETVDTATEGHTPTSAEEAAAAAARHGLEGSVLYVEIRRWEPDVAFRPSFVIVSLEMTLVDPETRRILWRADHPSRPIPTPGVATLGEAYTIAAQKVVEEMLSSEPSLPP